jgi:hypothetical protein
VMVVEWNQQQQAAQRLVFMVRPVGKERPWVMMGKE